MTEERVSRADLEAKLTAFQESVQGKVEDRKQTIVTVAAGAGLVLIVLFFLLGRRSGRKKTTLVEIRRV